MPPERLVRIYSLQSAVAWQRAREVGYFTGEADHVDEDFRHAYDWMREQMGERIPGYSGDYPVWAWIKRPNMRQWDRFDEPTVLVVADVPRRRVLASDYHAWHTVLNNSYDTASEEEWDWIFSAVPIPAPEPSLEAQRASWQKVFDLDDPPIGSPAWKWRGAPDVVQLCIDRVSLDEIVRVTPVIGRKTPWTDKWQTME
jgi:hypothetical protein